MRKPDAKPFPSSEATASCSCVLSASAWKTGGCALAVDATLVIAAHPIVEFVVVAMTDSRRWPHFILCLISGSTLCPQVSGLTPKNYCISEAITYSLIQIIEEYYLVNRIKI